METPIDRWVQRVTVATLVGLAALLMVLGIALYSPRASSHPIAAFPVAR